ncbi:MAG: ABC transporter permease [Acidobacteria bacterium]|nr:ABC transporter permease [Acidobacteriota bacterium]
MKWPWTNRRDLDRELDDEIAAHLALAARDIAGRGVAPGDAARQARGEFGNITLVKEVTRGMWRGAGLAWLWQDLRYAVRSLRHSPVFALAAIASLALGIGANTAIFSFVNALLLTRLPVPEASRLVRIGEFAGAEAVNTVASHPFIEELGKLDVFESVMGRYPVRVGMLQGGAVEPLRGELVTAGYFRALKVRPALGRLLDEQDILNAAGDPTCVISYSLWRSRFGADPAIIGRKLELNQHLYTVVGVAERGFNGPSLESSIDVQLPVSRASDFMGGFFAASSGAPLWKSAGFAWLEPLARLKPGMTPARAQAAFDPAARAIKQRIDPPRRPGPDQRRETAFRLTDGTRGLTGDSEYKRPVQVLMAVVGLVLLIACGNVAGLLLARASARARECAVRLSLGASRWRLARQFMTESLLIAALGGATGYLLALWIVATLSAYLNAGLPAGEGLRPLMDAKVLGFSVAITLLTALLFGLIPAWQSTRPDVLPELKGASGRGRAATGALLARRGVIVFQIALSVVILFGASLLTRTLSGLRTIDLGFNAAEVLTLRVDPALASREPRQAQVLFDEVLARLRGQAGVAAAAIASISPLDGGMMSLGFEVPGHAASAADRQTNLNFISSGYFDVLRQAFVTGRDFTPADSAGKPAVAIVNQLFARQYMPGVNPIGRRFKLGTDSIEIVGLVRDSRYQSLRAEPCPLIYLPASAESATSGYAVLVRTMPGAGLGLAGVERAIRSVNQLAQVYEASSLRDQVDRGISAERILSFLSGLFSALVTLLCGMGIYGLIAYGVTRRTREIGVRLAIGARGADIAALFLRESAWLIGAGVATGIPLALVSTRMLESVLYGVTSADPFSLAAAIAVFFAAGFAASALPVRRASRIAPSQALRYE